MDSISTGAIIAILTVASYAMFNELLLKNVPLNKLEYIMRALIVLAIAGAWYEFGNLFSMW